MDYDEFFAQYKSAHDLWAFGRLDLEAATAEVRRLRALGPSIEPADERRTAEYLLDQ
ncbi:hypothetical protein [Kribbella sp. NPDC048915]|uniref:hypothetical protein n=1 Tax=Kribbella sp. NPDC048915 TaxID=3155148 RepID=UPI0033F55A0C